MHGSRRVRAGLAAAALMLFAPAMAHQEHGRSLEADERDERLENAAARERASNRIRWRDSSWRRDAIVSVKLLGLNDFHGQLSPRSVGTRPAGGAAVLASYLKAASAQHRGDTFIIHAGDHVGASPPNSALLKDEPAISVLNLLANRHCIPYRIERALPDTLEPYAQVRCNVIGTLGNHEFDEGVDELLRLIAGGNH